MRVAWLVVGVALIGSLALFGVYRSSESAARESARALAYFPLELEGPLVYRITKSLKRRVLSEKFPRTDQTQDRYFSRLTLEPGSKQDPGSPRRTRAVRSEKCTDVAMALKTSSSSKEEMLVESPEGIRLADTGLLLIAPITPVKPAMFSLTFGLTRGGDGYFGWPLLEVVGMSAEENELFVESHGTGPDGRPVFAKPDADRQVLFNVMREESVRFIQVPGEEIELQGKRVKTIRLEYSGQLTKKNLFHQIGGAVWLAPGLGVVKEQRQVVFKAYPRDVLDANETFKSESGDVVLFEAEITKLLAHPI